MVGLELPAHIIAPPRLFAVFPVKTQFSIKGLEFHSLIPPPSISDELPVKIQFFTIGLEFENRIALPQRELPCVMVKPLRTEVESSPAWNLKPRP
jgi:hypothetical protein